LTRLTAQTRLKALPWLAWWVLGTYLLCSGHWGGPGIPAEDPAYFFQQVFQTLDHGTIPFRGYYSQMEFGHPGPILYWVLTLGGLIAKVFGFSVVSGGVIAYAGTVMALLLLTGAMVRRGTGSILAAVGTVAVGWWMMVVHLLVWDGGPFANLSVWPIFGPSMGSMFLLAGVASAAAALAGDRRAAWWAVILSGLAFQVNASFAIDAAILLLEGTWLLLRRRDWVRLVQALGLGYGAVIARMFVDGVTFPVEYVRQILTYNDELHSGTFERTPVTELLSRSWNLIGHESLVLPAGLFIALGIAVVFIQNRRFALYLAGAYVYTMLAVVYIVVKPHHAAIASPFLALGVGTGLGVLVEQVLKGLTRSRPRIHRAALTLIVLAVSAWSIPTGLSTYGSATQPELALSGSIPRVKERIEKIAAAVDASGVEEGMTVGFLSAKNEFIERGTVPHTYVAEILNAYSLQGASLCYAIAAPRANPVSPPACRGRYVDVWIAFDTDGRIATEPLTSIPIEAPIESQSLQLHRTTDPAELGFKLCKTVPSRPNLPGNNWFFGPACT
jgi:hypothetical protein